jgi:hypothetical protein
MRQLKIFTVCLLLTSCTAQAQNLKAPSPTLTSAPSPQTSALSTQSKRFTLKLTLSEKEDLKVREGDVVVKDQILADRTRDRQRLEAQKEQISLQIKRLSQPPIKPLAPKRIPDVAAFPAPSFLEEQANIDRLEIRVNKSTRDRDLQQRYLDAVQGLNDIPPSTLLHEQEKLKEKEALLKETIAELEVTKAKLDKSKRDHEYKEYQYSLELSKREIDIQRQQQEYQRQQQEWEKQERDRTFQLAQVTAQLQNLESQLANLSIVKSQYNGKIQRVKWLEQTNTNLSVELTLIVNDPRDFTRPNQTSTQPASTQQPFTQR